MGHIVTSDNLLPNDVMQIERKGILLDQWGT